MMIEKATLAETADKALERAKGALPVASRMLLSTVMTNADLLAELLGVSRDEVRERVDEFLRGRASHLRDGRQVRVDRSAPAPFDSSRPSRLASESRLPPDRPAAPSMREGGASRNHNASHVRVDFPARSAPVRKIGTAGALAAVRSVYDMSIGPNDVRFRTATLFDIVNAERAGSRYTRVMTLLRTRKAWPDGAKLPEVYTERELKDILDEANEAMPPLPLEVSNAR